MYYQALSSERAHLGSNLMEQDHTISIPGDYQTSVKTSEDGTEQREEGGKQKDSGEG